MFYFEAMGNASKTTSKMTVFVKRVCRLNTPTGDQPFPKFQRSGTGKVERRPLARLLDEGSNAKFGQLIAGMKFVHFLTPDMASKNDARHGIGFS